MNRASQSTAHLGTAATTGRRAPALFAGFALLIAMTSGAGAQQRPAIEAEVRAALSGCWQQDPTPIVSGGEVGGNFDSHRICFLAGHRVSMISAAGNAELIEVAEAEGTFSLAADKLHLRGRDWHGWPFRRLHAVCDVLVQQDVLALTGCVGSGRLPSGQTGRPERLDDVSYTRVADPVRAGA